MVIVQKLIPSRVFGTNYSVRSGTVESRVRQLVMKLEYVESLALAHPFIKGFEQVSYCVNDEEVRSVAQGEISEAVAKRKKEDIEGIEGASAVYSTTFYIGLAIEPKQRASQSSKMFRVARTFAYMPHPQAGAVGPRRLDISYPTTEFTKLVKMWEKFDEQKMGIVVRHIKRSHSYFPLPSSPSLHYSRCVLFIVLLYPTMSSTMVNASQD